jgi:hypothetical protein
MSDSDLDGIEDVSDNCPSVFNPDQADFNGDGQGDVCDDTDGDGLSDVTEFEEGTNPSLPDTDNDGVSDFQELYTFNTNPLDADTDHDGLSDQLEIVYGYEPTIQDSDGDGCTDELDFGRLCPGNGCPQCLGDLNGDGQVNTSDLLIFITKYGMVCP